MFRERLKTGWENWWSWNGEDAMIWIKAVSIAFLAMACSFSITLQPLITIPLILFGLCAWLFLSIWKHGE